MCYKRQWMTLSSAQTKVSNFPLKPNINPIYKIRFQTGVQIKFSFKLGFKPKIKPSFNERT